MTQLLSMLGSLLAAKVDDDRAQDERFLSAAADTVDLERRLKILESGHHHLDAIAPYGLFMR